MPVDFDPTRPIYHQIIETVKKRTVRGQYRAGAKLPSVREMAREMGVNPNTMARAYRELEREGFVTTHRGEGSFIAADPRRVDQERNRLAASARDRFVEEVRELALVPAQIHELLQDLVKGAEDG